MAAIISTAASAVRMNAKAAGIKTGAGSRAAFLSRKAARSVAAVAATRKVATRAIITETTAESSADSAELYKEFERLLVDYQFSYKVGDRVTGKVFHCDAKGAWVDIGAKAAALCPGSVPPRLRRAARSKRDDIALAGPKTGKGRWRTHEDPHLLFAEELREQAADCKPHGGTRSSAEFVSERKGRLIRLDAHRPVGKRLSPTLRGISSPDQQAGMHKAPPGRRSSPDLCCRFPSFPRRTRQTKFGTWEAINTSTVQRHSKFRVILPYRYSSYRFSRSPRGPHHSLVTVVILCSILFAC